MERNSLRSSLKHRSIGGGRSQENNLNNNRNNNNNNNRVNKDSWEYSSTCSEMMSHGGGGGGGGGDLLSGFPWPPRCHTCSFCKREFRSAQALGGHMNVHRRERARLRQSPPPRDGHDHHQYPFLNLNLNPNPKPNPNPNSSPSQNPDHPSSSQSPSPSSRFPPFTSTLLPVASTSTSLSPLSLPPSSASPSEVNKWVMEIDTDLAKIKSSETFLGAREFEGFAQGSECEVLKGKIVGLDLEIGLCSDSKDDLDLELRLGRS